MDGVTGGGVTTDFFLWDTGGGGTDGDGAGDTVGFGVQTSPAGQPGTWVSFNEARYAVVVAPGARMDARTEGEAEPPKEEEEGHAPVVKIWLGP